MIVLAVIRFTSYTLFRNYSDYCFLPILLVHSWIIIEGLDDCTNGDSFLPHSLSSEIIRCLQIIGGSKHNVGIGHDLSPLFGFVLFGNLFALLWILTGGLYDGTSDDSLYPLHSLQKLFGSLGLWEVRSVELGYIMIYFHSIGFVRFGNLGTRLTGRIQ